MSTFSKDAYYDMIEQVCSRHQSVQSAGFSGDAYKPGLERTRAFNEAAGNPAGAFKCIHIAGTNGKGSVCHMLASALAATGLRTGLYTSPHLNDFRERARIVTGNGFSLIPEEYVFNFLSNYMETADRLSLSFFEITTILAFRWFADKGVDIAVIETGLGGRLDSTNIITPELSIITSIGLDHCAILGNTRAEIAREKAGIIKPGRPTLIGSRDNETSGVFEKAASDVGSPLSFADDMDINTAGILETMDLKGEYQSQNLQTVLCALDILGIPVMEDALTNAAKRTGFHGRWEILNGKPLTIADIGHNPPALEWNFRQLEKIMPMHDKLTIVYGVMADKAVDDIIPMMPDNDRTHYIFVKPDTPRAMDADEILRRFSSHAHKASYETARSVQEGLQRARGISTDESVIYIGGSTYVVCEALKG